MNHRAPAAEFTPRISTTTRPWLEGEYIRVDGIALVYTETVREGLRVRLPGCKWATVEQLKQSGRTVVMPRSLRVD